MRDDFIFAVDRYLDHGQALSKFDDIAFGDQIAFAGFTQEVDIQAGGHGELDFTE